MATVRWRRSAAAAKVKVGTAMVMEIWSQRWRYGRLRDSGGLRSHKEAAERWWQWMPWLPSRDDRGGASVDDLVSGWRRITAMELEDDECSWRLKAELMKMKTREVGEAAIRR